MPKPDHMVVNISVHVDADCNCIASWNVFTDHRGYILSDTCEGEDMEATTQRIMESVKPLTDQFLKDQKR